MDCSFEDSLAQVDNLINLMDESYKQKIPQKLRILISQRKTKDYEKEFDLNIPLEKQDISDMALAIISVINYHFFVDDINEKQELLELFKQNEIRQEQEKQKLYNPNVFEENKKNVFEKNETNEKEIIEYKEPNIFVKITNKLKKLFKIANFNKK